MNISVGRGNAKLDLVLCADFSKVFRPTFTGRRFAELLWALDASKKIDLGGRKILDIASGTGLLGLVAAKRGGIVTCSDISSDAARAIQKNARLNHVHVESCASDGFSNIHKEEYDLI